METDLVPFAYGSDEQKYVEMNFHRPEIIEVGVQTVLRREPPRVLLLEGPPGCGRSYFVEAVHYRLNRDGHTTRFVRLDLDGHLPDDTTFADFSEFRRTREPELADRIDAVAACLQANVDSTSGCALGLALALYSDLDLRTLLDVYADGLSRPRDERHGDRDLLWNLLAVLSEAAPLLLHVQNWVELQPVMWRWLIDAARANDDLVVAVSAGMDEVSSWEYPGKYAHTRLVFRRMDDAEVNRILDLRLPGLFPPEFELGLGTVEDEDPCPGELMEMIEAFYNACAGLPSVMANLICDLIRQSLLVETPSGWRWSHEPNLFGVLSCYFSHSAIRRATIMPPKTPEAEETLVLSFLKTAAVCGQIVPVAPIGHFPLDLHETYGDWCRIILRRLGPDGDEHLVDGPYDHPGHVFPVFYLRNRALLHELRLNFSSRELKETYSVVNRHPTWRYAESRAMAVWSAGMRHLNPGFGHQTEHSPFWWFEYENAAPTVDLWNDLWEVGRLCGAGVEENLDLELCWSPERRLAFLDMREAMVDPLEHPEAHVRMKADILIEADRPEEAVSRVTTYLNETEQRHGSTHPRTGEAVALLGETLMKVNREAEAGPRLSRAAAIFASTFETGHPRHLAALLKLAEWHEALGADAAAAVLRERVRDEERGSGIPDGD